MESSEKLFVTQILERREKFSSRFEDDFKITGRLGKGGFGDVFAVCQEIDECEYAVKRIIIPNEEQSIERVLREVKSLAKLDHPNIVRYFSAWWEYPPPGWKHSLDETWSDNQSSYDDGFSSDSGISEISTKINGDDSSIVFEKSESEDAKVNSDDDICVDHSSSSLPNHLKRKVDWKQSGEKKKHVSLDTSINKNKEKISIYLYIQMQLCKEHTLKDWLVLHNKRMYDQIISFFSQILDAVEYIHHSRLMHRDLKPSNILFSWNDKIKVGDFGLVKDVKNASNLELTKCGTPTFPEDHTQDVGTQLYMSPEQIEGTQYDEKVDIYSLGLIFFELLVPFSTEMERIKTITSVKEQIYPLDFSQKFPYELKIIEKMLYLDPSKRLAVTEIKNVLKNRI